MSKQGYYPKTDVDAMFDKKTRENVGSDLRFLIVGLDIEKDGTASCIVFYIDRLWDVVIIELDMKSTILKFNDLKCFFEDIMKSVRKLLENSEIPIFVVLETKSRLTDSLKEFVDDTLKSQRPSDSDFKNVVFLNTESIKSQNRSNEMTFRMSAGLKCGVIKIHPDFATTHANGTDWILNELKSQLTAFRQLKDPEFVLANTLHLVSWGHWFLFKPEFNEVRTRHLEIIQ